MSYLKKAKPCSRMDIRQMAYNVRIIEGCQNKLFFDIVHFMDVTLPQIVPNYTLEIVENSEMGNALGLTYPDRGLVKIRDDVYDGASQGNGRDRLTMAHELFHLLQHDESNIVFARASGNQTIKKYEDPEWQADAFGGELLIPHHMICGMPIDKIIIECQVSAAAARYQMKYA